VRQLAERCCVLATAELPAIATDVGGVVNGETGLSRPGPRDTAVLADVMAALSGVAALPHRIGNAGPALCRRRNHARADPTPG
jgi:hypothetical protein